MTGCPHLNHHIMLLPDGRLKPCCRFTLGPQERDWRGPESMTSVFLSERYDQIRQSILDGERPTSCKKCWKEEDRGMPSMRMTGRERFPEYDPAVKALRAIEIGVGRICNLKCRSCNALYSTEWQHEDQRLGRESVAFEGTHNDLDRIPDDVIETLTILKITGGEPFMHKRFFRFLDRIQRSGRAKEIDIQIYTNGTIAPSETFMAPLRSFKTVDLRMSIDAIGVRSDYIRSGSDWATIDANVRTYHSVKPKNWKINIAHTVSIYNILYFEELLQWLDTFGTRFHVAVQHLHGLPRFMCPTILPETIRQRIDDHLASINRLDYADALRSVRSILAHGSGDDLDLFLKETAALDAARGEDFTTTFPELADLIGR